MPTPTHGRHRALLGLLPLLSAAALAMGLSGTSAAATGTGVVDARAALLPAPSADQMMMPMDAGMQHADELQVVLALRNDTDGDLTVPFGRIALLGAGGDRITATGGLVGDLVLRPHAGAEERLRFPAPGADRVRLSVPAGAADRTLDLPVAGASAAPQPAHHHG